jgi:hypothetical protein
MEVTDDGGAAVFGVADHPALVPALRALGRWWAPRARGRLKVERWHGDPILGGPGASSLEAAGFARDLGAMVWVGDATPPRTTAPRL